MDPIAVIGMSCEFAGDVDSPEVLWKVLKDSIDIGSTIPTDWLKDIDSYYAYLLKLEPSIKHNLMRAGYFMNADRIIKFDSNFFGISNREAATIDPCHRILLEKFVHLMEDAGYPLDQIRGTRTAVYIGQYTNDHQAFVSRQQDELKSRFTYPNNSNFNASARISYHFNLHGPNLTLNTGCSSSLQALQLGIQSLRNNDADFAVVGGTNLNYSPETFFSSGLMSVVSVDGRSRSYSSDANGYAKGDGIGLVLLKKLSNAKRDLDRIYCLIRDVIANHDGNELKTGYSAPSPAGQDQLLTEIYTRNQLDPKAIFYVEGHGTGTEVGDPIEANTLGAFFKRSNSDTPLLIGSIKSNIGHTEGTSGIAALIKIAMCMKYRTIPPNMHFTEINKKIRAKEYNLQVVNSFVPFPKDLVTVGINSFGIGGNNAHAIVTEWKHIEEMDTNYILESAFSEDKQYFLLVFTTKCKGSMKSQIEKFFSWFLQSLQEITDSNEQLFLGQLCYKRLFKRTIMFPISTIFIFADSKQLKSQLSSFVADQTVPGIITSSPSSSSFKQNGNICFVFSGQGPQWWAMGRELYSTEPVFRHWINKIDLEFSSVTNEWSLKQELINTEDETYSRINDTNIAQPTLFAVQVALAALWLAWGTHPKVIIGHSVGEIAAVFVAGRLTLSESVKIIYHRARLQHMNTRQGGRMLAVSVSEADANQLITGVNDRISIAAINSPQSVTLSGDSAVLEEIYDILTELKPKVFKTWLRVENAFHSHQMDRFNIQNSLIASLTDIKGCTIPLSEVFDVSCSNAALYSTVTGHRVHDDFIFDGKYWWNNMRYCVNFSHAMKSIIEDIGTDSTLTYLEISPHPVLHSSIQECLDKEKSKSLIFSSLKRKQNEQQTMLSTLCSILSLSDLKTFWKTRSYSKHCHNDSFINSTLDHLPLYVFDNQICWLESKESILERNVVRKQQHPLLGTFIWNNTDPLWKNVINLNSPQYSFLKDHVVQGNTLFPAAGFIEISIAAVNELLDHSSTTRSNSITLENISILNALILNIDETTEIITVVRMPFKDISIYSRRKALKSSIDLLPATLVEAYTDNYFYDYSQKEWTLHYYSLITIKNDSFSFTSYYHIESLEENVLKTNVWSLKSEDEIKSLYKYFTNHDYQYGPFFRNIKSICATESKVLGEIMMSNNLLKQVAEYEFEKYYFNPILLDACFQTALICLSNEETFVPISIDKLILCGKKLNGHSFVHTSIHSPVRGVIKDESFIFDTIIYDKTETTSQMIAIFQGINIQKIPSRIYKRFPESVFQKIEDSAVVFPNRTTDASNLQMLIEHYCLKPDWKQLNRILGIKTLLPSPNILFNSISINDDNKVNRIEIEKYSFEMDNDKFEQFIQSVNNFVAQWAFITIKKLLNVTESTSLKSVVSSKHHKLYASMINVLQSEKYLDENCKILIEPTSITEHTIKMFHLKLSNQIPRLKSLLSLISVCGQNLHDVLTEKIVPLQLLFSPENTVLLQDIYSTLTEINIKFPFLTLTDYLEKKINEHQDFRRNTRVLKILEVGGGTGASTIHILTILSDFANRTGTKIEYVFTDISSSFFERAQTLFSEIFQEKNSSNLLELSYKQFDLEKSILKDHELNPESFDIVLAANVVHATSNIAHSLSNIRELLIPGGLVILIEVTIPMPCLDIIFGMLPQWWTFDNNDQVRLDQTHAIISTKKWLKAFDLAKGFEQIDCASNKLGGATIIARKSEFLPILNDLSERKQQVFIIFCDKREKIGEKFACELQKHFNSKQIVIVSYVDEHTDNIYSSSVVHISLSNVATDIRKLFQDMFSCYSRLTIVFAWALDIEPLTDNFNNTLNTLHLQETFGCGSLMHILQAIRLYSKESVSSNIFVFTQNAQPILTINSNFNPAQSPIVGITRSFMLEYTQRYLKLIDIQSSLQDLLSELVSEILLSITSTPLSIPIDEISLIQDTINHVTKRYVPTLKNIEFNRKSDAKIIIPSINSDDIQFRLKLPSSRFIPDLQWITMMPNRSSLNPTEVEIKIHSVGINFRDVLKIRGLFPHICELTLEHEEQNATADEGFGSDFSGTITRMGTNVDSTFKVGDTVFGVTHDISAFKSHMIIDQNKMVHMSKNLTMEEACTLPAAFSTVMIALEDRAHLEPGQSILIHTATGAVGIAAIQYCQMIGNINIICTAGSEVKRQFLREKFGIKHIFNSRDLSFVHNVRQIVPDGVDIVINTLAGVLLQASIELLAPSGHFIELGKRDVFSKGNISLFKIRSNCSFHVIDLAVYQKLYPSRINSMLNRIATNCKDNIWKPIFPITLFEPSEVKEAFTLYHQTTNVGKLVVGVTSSNKELQLRDEYNVQDQLVYFGLKEQLFPDYVCNNGTILISGGLGGIGIAMSKWMIEKRGVKRILLMSRRSEQDLDENDPQYYGWIALKEISIKYHGSVVVVKADVTQFDRVLELIKQINQSPYPLRGIIHGALVLQDKLLDNMTQEELSKVMKPRIHGLWNLHCASEITSSPLHFFIMLSSLRNYFPNFGGSNYNATNEFFDAFAHWRFNCKHLPALSISIPVVSNAGFYHRNREVFAVNSIEDKYEKLSARIVFELIEKFYINQQRVDPVTSPIIAAVKWKILHSQIDTLHTRLMDIVKQEYNLAANGKDRYGDKSLADIETLSLDIDKIINKIRLSVARMFGSSSTDRIDIGRPLIDQGMDSLTAVSLYNWLGSEFTIYIPLAEILQGISINNIASYVQSKLHEKYSMSTVNATITSESSSTLTDKIEGDEQ